MSKVFVSDTYLSDIADAIRTKNGAQTQYYPREMAAAITALDTEEHKPIQVNIQQSANQTIKVKVKQKELNSTTINTNVEPPETIQLEATVTANEGYIPGTLNQTSVNAAWGSTINFSASQATEKINITITAYSDEKEYDGSELSNSGYILTGELSVGDVLDNVVVTGSQTEVGSSSNVITSYKILRNGKPINVADYYNVTLIAGTLTVTKATVEIIIEGTEPDVIYDGQEHYPTEYEVTGWPDDTDDELVVTLVPSGDCVNVGTVTYTIEYEIIYNDNPRKYDYIVDEDQLEYTFQILKRPITI